MQRSLILCAPELLHARMNAGHYISLSVELGEIPGVITNINYATNQFPI